MITLKTFMRVLSLFALIVFITACIAIFVYVMRNTVNAEIPQQIIRPVTMLIDVVIIIFFTIILTYITYRLAKPIIIISNSLPSKIISLGIATAFFPRVVSSFILVPLQLYRTIVEKSAQGSNDIVDLDKTTKHSFDFLIMTIAEGIRKTILMLFDELSLSLQSIPIIDTIQFIAWWIVMCFLLDILAGRGSGRAGVATLWQSLSEESRKISVLTALFIASFFLSISAMITLPWLEQDKSPDAINKDRLKQRLEELSLTKAVFDLQYPDSLENIEPIFKQIQAVAEENKSEEIEKAMQIKIPAINKFNWDTQISNLRSSTEELTNTIKRTDEEWLQDRKNAWQLQGRSASNMLNQYEISMLSPMSTKERSIYFDRAINGHEFIVDRYTDHLNRYLVFRKSLVGQLRNEPTVRKTTLANAKLNLQDTSGFSLSRYGYAFNPYLLQKYPTYVTYTNLPSLNNDVAENENVGFSWGPFGWTAQWLIKSDSFALALITGMLGFGMFGATIAFFIRKRPGDNIAKVSYEDLLIILVRGFSAAIVIFLAVQGGLSIFNGGATKPNPYVLFFTCFIGAVFSEDVWQWAQKRLQDNVVGNASDETEKAAKEAEKAAKGAEKANADPQVKAA
jgi:hypothetical protein